MDGVMITVVLVLCVIAAIEAVSLFCHREDAEELMIAVAVAVTAETENIGAKLECAAGELRGFNSGRIRMVIVDLGMTKAQQEECRLFCAEHPLAVIAFPDEAEKILSKTFAIERKV